MIKKYISTTGGQLNFPVVIKGKRSFVCAEGEGSPLVTSDASVQRQVEECAFFKRGDLVLYFSETETGDEEEVDENLTDQPLVVKINDAIELLENSPYNIPAGTIKTVADAKRVGAELGLTFSNLKSRQRIG